MPTRGVLAMALFLAGCDDTLYRYPPPIVDYDPDWDGIVAFTYDNCRVCHPGVVPSVPLPEAIEDDVRCTTHKCDKVVLAMPSQRQAEFDRDHPFEEGAQNDQECVKPRERICGDYVVPFEPEESYFWRVISETEHEPGDQMMPMTGYLPARQVEFVKEWIELGAPL